LGDVAGHRGPVPWAGDVVEAGGDEQDGEAAVRGCGLVGDRGELFDVPVSAEEGVPAAHRSPRR
jgi:hypothetical protein